MTPTVLNHIAVEAAPYKAKIYRAMLLCGVLLGAALLVSFILEVHNEYFSLTAWGSAITLGWLSLLTSVIQWHHKQPEKPEPGFLKRLKYTWLKIVTWFHCVIISISSLMLSYVTFAAFFNILFGYGS